MLFALIIIPPAIARLLTNDLKVMMAVSVLSGAFGAAAGTALSFAFNLPVSATVVLFNCGLYGLTMLIKRKNR